MGKMKKYRPAGAMADAVAQKGPHSDQRLKGSLSMPGVIDNSMIHYFPSAQGPKVGRVKPMYPGSDQRIKRTTVGPTGTDSLNL